MRRNNTESSRRLSTAFWKAGADRYNRFVRAQEHESQGQFRLALRAYEGAGALKSAAAMRAKVTVAPPLDLKLVSSLTSFDVFWARRRARQNDPQAA